MSTLQQAPSIVMLGAWNPSILQPDWLATHIFDKAADENLPIEMQFSPIPGLSPRFTIRDITLVPSAERLAVFSKNCSAAQLDAAESVAIRLLSSLSHTPISAVGENFAFSIESPSDELLSFFDADNALSSILDFEYSVVQTELKTTIKLSRGVLNFSRIQSEGDVAVHFNFHYSVSSAANAASEIQHTLARNFSVAREILTKLNVPFIDEQGEEE
jgi:hypothetical protein